MVIAGCTVYISVSAKISIFLYEQFVVFISVGKQLISVDQLFATENCKVPENSLSDRLLKQYTTSPQYLAMMNSDMCNYMDSDISKKSYHVLKTKH